MESLFFLALVAIAAFVALIFFKGKAGSTKSSFRYAQRKQLLSPAEVSFYSVLCQAAGNENTVLAKVRLADVLTPQKGYQRSDWQKAFNRISAKHFDFLLCEKSTLKPVLAIELDDSSHNNKKAKASDAVKNEACKTANLRLVRIKAQRTYSVSAIQQSLANENFAHKGQDT
mgnify:CR=1 FL=1